MVVATASVEGVEKVVSSLPPVDTCQTRDKAALTDNGIETEKEQIRHRKKYHKLF